jgi:2-polyprenyl-3-methyl-5-hydroxy-6-metoxy-1,4-benzoquinol methylase/GNAT superfamily N-acetyltransferase
LASPQSISNPNTLDLVRLEWGVVAGRDATGDEKLLEECCALYTAHYGVWSDRSPRAGKRIKMSPARLASVLAHDRASLAVARSDGAIVGYCSSVRVPLGTDGDIAWVTQLVVHTDFRHDRIGTQLLYSTWGFSDCIVWGLATANPLAVRALETATRRTCRRIDIVRRAPQVLTALQGSVDYLPLGLAVDEGKATPLVDTKFDVDISNISTLRRHAQRRDRPWDLGDLASGHEWLACTFQSQRTVLTDDRLEMILQGADRVWLDAYARMSLDERHKWHRHTKAEVDAVMEFVESDARIVDIGCGDGRHVHEMIKREVMAVGIDAVPALIEAAAAHGNAASFSVANARDDFGEAEFDAATMLYDVLGSSGRSEDDHEILRRCHRALRPEGKLVLGVMNAEPTLSALPSDRQPSDVAGLIAALERLPASNTMQSTGDVFDTAYLLYYRGVFYRKEQFSGDGANLPAEHIVRDRRFVVAQISKLLNGAGFAVLEVRPVQAGQWDRTPPLSAADPRAKELLVFAQRR